MQIFFFIVLFLTPAHALYLKMCMATSFCLIHKRVAAIPQHIHATAAYLAQNGNEEIAINIFQYVRDKQQHFISCVEGAMCNISNCSIGMK